MTHHAKPVFLSYATRTGSGLARAIEQAVGPALVYRDESNLEHGKPFPDQLFEALVEARVVVCLVDEAYFASWFCRAELDVALAAFRESEDAAALAGLVFAFPAGSKHASFRELPPALQQVQWPRWDATDTLVDLIRARLQTAEACPIRARLSPHKLEVLRGWLNEEALMVPRQGFAEGQLAANLPQRPEGRFFGRASQLVDIHSRLLPVAGPAQCAIIAPGGGGKTRLAREYLWRYGATHYPGGVLWIDAANPGAEESQFHRALAQLIPHLPDLHALRQAGVDIRKRLREKLEERRDLGPVLWVIDNVPEPAPGERPRPLTDWHVDLPGQIAVLATSRMRQSPPEINCDLAALRRADAIVMLRHELPAELLRNEIAEVIATAVGDWPLALELLNRSFAEDALTPTEFLAHHARDGISQVLDDAMAVLQDQVPEGALRGATETLLLSYERPPEEAQLLARILACCAPMTPIPNELLQALGREIATPKARTALKARSFLTLGDVDSCGIMHPLLSAFLRAQDRRAEGIAHATTALLQLSAALDGTEASSWPVADRLVPHIQAVGDHPSTGVERALAVAQWLATLLNEQGHSVRSLAVCEAAEARWGAEPGPDTPPLLALQSVHGDALQRAGQADQARMRLETVATAQEMMLGSDHLDTLLTRSNLAETLWALGNLAGARWLFEAVLADQKRLLGPDHPHTLNTRGNLAVTLRFLGDLAGARRLYEAVLADRERLLGPDHPETLRTRSNLAVALWTLGDLAGARRLFEAVLADRERLLGSEHPDTLNTRGNLAASLHDMGDLAGARRLHKAVLADWERVLGPAHPDTLLARSDLAATLRALGDLAGARRLCEAVLADRERLLGPDHPYTQHTRGSLALTLHDMGDHTGAQRLAEAVLADLERLLGPNHQKTLELLRINIAIRRALGETEAALTLAEASMERHVAAFGPTHPDTLLCRYELACVRAELGERAAAIAVFREVLAGQRTQLDVHHFKRNQTAAALYALLADVGDPSAEQLFRDELAWLLELDEAPQALVQRHIREALLERRQAASLQTH